MSDAIIMRTGSTISPSASPTEDRESGAADRKSEKSASVSSCSSQETVLGAGDVCGNRQLPSSAIKSNGGWHDSNDGSRSPTRRLDNFNGDEGGGCGGGEEVFFDEQPQMALMSPLVTRWRRAQSNGAVGKNDFRCNNNSPSSNVGGQFGSCGRSTDSPTAGCRPGDSQMIDGYATFRGRKLVSKQSSSSSAAAARNRNGNEPTSGVSSPFDRSTSPTGIIGDNGGTGGGAARLQKLRTENRFTPPATSAMASSANKRVQNDGVDTKALQNLHQPWRRLNSRGGDTDVAGAHRPAAVITSSPTGKIPGNGGQPTVGSGNGSCVSVVVTGCSGNGDASPRMGMTSCSDMDGRSKRKPAVGKLSLFDRLPAFMLQSHQTKQQQQQEPSAPQSPTSSPWGASPTTSTSHTPFSSTPRSVKGDGQRTAQSRQVQMPTSGVPPAKFDDADEEALSPMVTSAVSRDLDSAVVDDFRSNSSPIFDSSPLSTGGWQKTGVLVGSRANTRSPSSDRQSSAAASGDRPLFAGVLAFPVSSDSSTLTTCHTPITEAIGRGKR